VTVDEFLVWVPPDGEERWSLVDGVPVPWLPLPPDAGALLAEAGTLIGDHLRDRWRLVTRTRARFSPNTYNVHAPGVSVSAERTEPGQILLREPFLAVEIVCPATAETLRTSVPLYRTMPSMQEIVVLDGGEIRAELWRRTADDAWVKMALAGGDVLELACIGFAAPLSAFYSTAA
jgi:Uma2 family endonuclease